MFALSCLGGGQCAGYGATAHKELAWLSLLKEVAPLDNTTAAFGQKRIYPEMDTFVGHARSGEERPFGSGQGSYCKKNRAGFTLPGFDF